MGSMCYTPTARLLAEMQGAVEAVSPVSCPASSSQCLILVLVLVQVIEAMVSKPAVAVIQLYACDLLWLLLLSPENRLPGARPFICLVGPRSCFG
jgi:hypothetical protein